MELLIRRMDAPLLSHLMNEIPSAAASAPQSKLYSSWSVCGDDTGTPCTQGHRGGSYPLAFSDVECSRVIGSESQFPAENNGRDLVTDWNSLSRLFPPLWAAADHHDLSEYFPSMPPGRADFSDVLSPPLYEEPGRKLPDLETLHRGFEDLGLLDTWVSGPNTCSDEVDDFLKDLYIERPVLDPSPSVQPVEGADPCMDRLNPPANAQSHKGPQGYAGVHRPWWRNDKTKGKVTKPTPAAPKYRPGMRDPWDTDLYGKPPSDFTPLSAHHPREAAHRKPYSGAPDNFNTFPNIENFNYREPPLPGVSPSEGFHQQWLEVETARNQNQASSPLPSPIGSTISDGSPTHHPGHFSGLPLSKKEGQHNGPPYQENRGKAFSHLSPSKEGVYRNTPPSYPPNWSPPQHTSAPGRPERYAKKPSPPINNHTERRGRRGGWSPQYGKPIPPVYGGFQRKQEPNMGNMSDFINASFLPSFSLMADIKQSPSLPFNPSSFSPPTGLPFPPPFPYSDLIDLFHCEDLGAVPPFINDLFCGDSPPPFLPFPAPFNKYRPSRNRSGPANELHVQLEECCEQWRALEKERKKTEAELAVKFPGHRISSSYTSSIPRLPANPSRVDRLAVDQFREQARAVSLVKIMERIRGETLHVNIHMALEHHLEAVHLTQARRKDEIINAANRQKQGVPRYNNERDVLALAAAIKEMVLSTRRARTALWCALQITLPKSSSGATVKQEDIERALQELCPTKPPSADTELLADVGFGCGRDGSAPP